MKDVCDRNDDPREPAVRECRNDRVGRFVHEEPDRSGGPRGFQRDDIRHDDRPRYLKARIIPRFDCHPLGIGTSRTSAARPTTISTFKALEGHLNQYDPLAVEHPEDRLDDNPEPLQAEQSCLRDGVRCHAHRGGEGGDNKHDDNRGDHEDESWRYRRRIGVETGGRKNGDKSQPGPQRKSRVSGRDRPKGMPCPDNHQRR